jgi:curved DNA-binding protein CbpA
MAEAALSIKLRCASWQQLATIYKRDLSKGTMFLKAATPPAIGTRVRIDLTLPSASVIALSGVVASHVTDPTRGAGVDLKLDPLPSSSVWLIESALSAETKVRAGSEPGAAVGAGATPPRRPTPASGVSTGPTRPVVGDADKTSTPNLGISDGHEVAAAEHELIGALMSEAESLRKLNPFLVLGVGYEASDADVRAAFGELTKRYHPDRFARYASPDLRKVAAEIFILIRDAYRKLSDEASRTQALQSLGKLSPPRAVPAKKDLSTPPARVTGQVPLQKLRTEPGVIPGRPTPASGLPVVTAPAPTAANPPTPTPSPSPPLRPTPPRPGTPPPIPGVTGPISRPTPPDRQSRPGFRDRQESRSTPGFGGRTPPEVTSPLPNSAKADPPAHEPTQPIVPPLVDTNRPVPLTSPQIVNAAEAGDTTGLDALLDAGKLDEAIAVYKLLTKKHPGDRSYRAGVELVEGLRALHQRDRMEAAQRFEAALEIDPSNERAARELAEMRRQATNERKGLLSRLMGKKEP